MNCLECQAWLQRRLDGEEFAPGEAVEQHWSQCPACREQYTAGLRLLEGVKRLPRVKPRAGFADVLAAKVLQDRRHRQSQIRRRVFLTTALAASILVMLLASYYWLPHDQQTVEIPKETVVITEQKKQTTPPARVEVKKPAVTQKTSRKAEPRNALASLTGRWADTTRDHATVVLVAANLDTMEKLPGVSELPPLDAGVREASQEVTDGVRAVTRNARRALDFFARELPMPEIDEPKQ